ncbi:penicillin-binding transpeptidase domain-containing protein [Ornithinibacillus sp. BX22]|uniref:serine-type D-Ala-D-Ala carboxypeptidase n=2 Tax=Ornithinibacillus TaxID=484508 RepID=A0A923L7P4_9BACI|nr:MULTISPECIES: penicillin-binding transpeptidase domain-containing protein [Ornithinibacillus]MBC5637922.1 penicillin-binding transpeptidase domain-containing protein [Ornithinibacillus hominis]MBS3681714.1 penicillin-binding transpeptidase domain-containing protein [Ornithinibacillus massiliensis]
MKRFFITFALFLALILAGCSEDKVTPHDRLDDYFKLWEEQSFSSMYDMLTEEAKQAYHTDQYIDRYEKIYQDLHITEIQLHYEKLSDEKIKQALEEGTATIPFSASLTSMAGPIEFDYEVTLKQAGEEEEKNWFIDWNPGFIFPEIKDGGEIRISTTEPKRGDILDRNRLPLALNGIVYEVGIVPGQLGDNPEASKKKLASLLNISVASIDNALNESWVQPDLFVPIGKKVQESDQALLDQLWQMDGVMTQQTTGRIYPLGKAAAHVVGYVRKITAEELEEKDPERYTENDMIGSTGLERRFEDELKGEKGVKIYVTEDEKEVATLAMKPVEDGKNIQTTLDITVQEELFNSLDDAPGTAAAIHPKTGETLALVSSPSFDPNKLVYGISQSDWEALQDNPEQPLFNRFNATYAPGSVIKPVTAAIGLQNGTIKPEEELEIKGLSWGKGESWGNYEVTRVSEANPVDLMKAMALSDNIYFAMKGVEMGGDQLVKGLEQFGFGEQLPINFPISTSTISTSGTLDDEVLVANTSYGQGEVEASVLHLATMYTSFLNNGNMIKPILLMEEEPNQVWKEGLLSPEQATIVQETLRNVVTDGTAGYAKNASFPISGKTGTAELKLTLDEENGEQNGWFVGYPTEDQDIIIAMMMEKVQDLGASGLVVQKVTDVLEAIKE